jgi:uncharacterized repeat protein (TIGR01451 family)
MSSVVKRTIRHSLLLGITLAILGFAVSASAQSTPSPNVFRFDLTRSAFETSSSPLTTESKDNFSDKVLTVGDKIRPVADTSNDTPEFSGDATVASLAPNVALLNSVFPSGVQPAGTDLIFTVAFANGGGQPAQGFTVVDPIPSQTDFKLDSPSAVLGTTGLTPVVEYSNDNGSTWMYTPVSGGGGASAGYDRLVTHVRWRFNGNLSQIAPDNSGSVSLTARIR